MRFGRYIMYEVVYGFNGISHTGNFIGSDFDDIRSKVKTGLPSVVIYSIKSICAVNLLNGEY